MEQSQLMSLEMIEEISRKNFENKAARDRGEQPPHQISQADLVRCLQTVRAMRSTGGQRPASKEKGTVTKEMKIDSL